jgi:hypothetical protein
MLRTIAQSQEHLWDTLVPALLYAYNNTVHSATGCTPHSYLSARTAEFAKVQKALNKARQVMIRQRNASANAHVYAVGDLVKISYRVLQPRSLCRKFQPLCVGPFEVTSLLGPKLCLCHCLIPIMSIITIITQSLTCTCSPDLRVRLETSNAVIWTIAMFA